MRRFWGPEVGKAGLTFALCFALLFSFVQVGVVAAPAPGGLPEYPGVTEVDLTYLYGYVDLPSGIEIAAYYTTTGSSGAILSWYRTQMSSLGWTNLYDDTMELSYAGYSFTYGILAYEKGSDAAAIVTADYGDIPGYEGYESYTILVLAHGSKTEFEGLAGAEAGTWSGMISEGFEVAEVEVQFREKIDNITPGVPGIITVENTDVVEVKINVGTEVENVVLTIQQFTEKPPQAEVAAPGTAYKYLDLVAENITSGDIENVEIKFKVERSWVTEQGIDVDTITLQRYDNVEAKWVSLDTNKVDEDAAYVYFSATSSSLSLFCVVGEKPSPKPFPLAMIGGVVVVALVVMIVIALTLYKRRAST